MSLREKQSEFAVAVSKLIRYINDCYGYSVTLGDAYAKTGHKDGSFHYKRLAIDLNLFYHGKYQTSTKAHEPFGEYWEELDPQCTWGGRFKKKDGNHYSFGEK